MRLFFIFMPHSLRHNLTSAYLDAARRLSPRQKRRRIVAYVESYDDVAFWRTLLSEFETDECYFQVMLPSQDSLSKGKKTVLLNTLNADELGSSLIACVDSDYDFLMQGATAQSRRINGNPFVLQTYAYAIENYLCYAESLHEVCVQSTLNDRQLLNFPEFMLRYSHVAYPLFLWNIWFYRHHDNTTFPMYEFNRCTCLQDVSLTHPYRCLEDMSRRVDAKLAELHARFPQDVEQVTALGEELEPLGLTPDTTYLYIQGHHLMDGVVMKLLNPVCTQLRREREKEIRRLAVHDEQLRNELTGYENSLAAVQLMLRKNDGYKGLFLYQWMREDVRRLLAMKG